MLSEPNLGLSGLATSQIRRERGENRAGVQEHRKIGECVVGSGWEGGVRLGGWGFGDSRFGKKGDQQTRHMSHL